MEYEINYDGLNGANNQGGTTETFYFAPITEFLTIADFMTATAPGDEVTVDTDHTFDLGKGFSKIYGTLDTGKFDVERVGERDGYSFKINGEFFHPGTNKVLAEMAAKAKNDRFICLYEDPNGYVIQVGTKLLPANISFKYSSGSLTSGRKGYTLMIEAYSNWPQIFYEGIITLKTV